MKKLLLATDLSSRAAHALDRALLLARQHQAELRVLSVVEGNPSKSLADAQRAEAERIFAERVQPSVGGADVSSSLSIATGKAFAKILEEATLWQADLIVIGTHQRDVLKDLFRGTTAERVIQQGRFPTLVVREGALEHYKRAVVGIDFSLHALRAAQCAFRLAPAAEFHLVHSFLSPFPHLLSKESRQEARDTHAAAMEREISEELAAFLARFGDQAPPVKQLVVHGMPQDVLLGTAAHLNADLIVVGTHGRVGIAHAMLGSVAADLLSNAPCDVLVAKAW